MHCTLFLGSGDCQGGRFGLKLEFEIWISALSEAALKLAGMVRFEVMDQSIFENKVRAIAARADDSIACADSCALLPP